MLTSLALQETGKQESLPAEGSLIQAAVAGDLSAFNHLVVMHQDDVYWWVFSLVKDEELASDVTQSTFIKAYEKLGDYRGGSFRAWLFTIARNRCYDELRWQKRHLSVSLDDSTDDAPGPLDILPTGGPLPEDELLTTELADSIERLLNSLPEIFQQVIRLVDMEGLDYQDAANILGLPLGTVKSRLTRARQRMRALFLEATLV